MPPRLREMLASLEVEPSHGVYQSVMDEIGGSFERLGSIRRQPSLHMDASGLDSATLRRWLTDLPVNADATVRVAWVADRVGVEMRFGDFVTRVDDLWYPAMDDVVAALDGGQSLDVLVIDHEEHVTFTRKLAQS